MEVTFDTVFLARKGKEIVIEATRRAEEHAAGDGSDAGGQSAIQGSRGWIKYYAGAKKFIKEQLTTEERKEYQEEVTKWRTTGVPPGVKAE